MGVARDQQHQCGAYQCGADDGQELCPNQVEVQHQRNAWRHEEEAQIGYQKVGKTSYPFQFYHFYLQQQREQQHTYDA